MSLDSHRVALALFGRVRFTWQYLLRCIGPSVGPLIMVNCSSHFMCVYRLSTPPVCHCGRLLLGNIYCRPRSTLASSVLRYLISNRSIKFIK